MKLIHVFSAAALLALTLFISVEYFSNKAEITTFSKNTIHSASVAPGCSITGAEYVCSNSSGNIYTAPPGMTSYLWTITGNGTIQGSTTSQSVSVTSGNYINDYTVSVTITDGTGSSSCSRTSYIYLLKPPADITGNQDTVCFGVTISLSIPSASSSTVTWSGEGIANPNGTHVVTNPDPFTIGAGFGYNQVTAIPTTTGPHIYSVNVTAALSGCTNSSMVSIYVKGVFPFYSDADGDGYGAGAVVNICAINANTPPSGYSLVNGDCDDADPAIKPGALEICDNKDNDCDGQTDEGHASFAWNTGPWSSCSSSCGPGTQTRTVTCRNGSGLVVADCNCSGSKPVTSQACNGVTFNTYYRDFDNDGFGSLLDTATCTAPPGFVVNSSDCNDNDNSIYPGAPELCDAKDNDCDNLIDEGAPGHTWVTGLWSNCSVLCGPGTQTRSVTCQNQSGQAVPDCNCIDTKPDTIQACSGQTFTTYYRDGDNDGFGGTLDTFTCIAPPGYVINNTDCNDNDNSIYLGAPELCDAKDNDCDNQTDEGAPGHNWVTGPWSNCSVLCGQGTQTRSVACQNQSGQPVADINCDCNKPATSQACFGQQFTTFYRDFDNDGYGNPLLDTSGCTAPAGYVINNTDCNDADNTTYPGATEICDAKDNDCDGQTDEGVAGHSWVTGNWSTCSAVCGQGTQTRSVTCQNQSGQAVPDCNCIDTKPDTIQACSGQTFTTYYRDVDNDGFGGTLDTFTCIAPPGYVSNNTDCNDTNPGINPGASDANCNGIDEDCDGTADDNYIAAACTACIGGVVVSTVGTVAITGLTYMNVSSTSVKLSWDLNNIFESYTLEYRSSGGWISIPGILSNMYTLTNLTINLNYEWRVRGRCTGGILGKYGTSTFNTFALCAVAPTGLAATSVTGNSATLNWNSVSGAVSYTVQSPHPITNIWTTIATVNTNTYNWTGLLPRRLYLWRVSANCSAISSPFASSQFRTKNALIELENRSTDITIKAFPNPVKEKLSIVLSDGSLPSGINLFDTHGKLLQKYGTNTNVVDMKPFASGIYILQVRSDRMIENIKVFKE